MSKWLIAILAAGLNAGCLDQIIPEHATMDEAGLQLLLAQHALLAKKETDDSKPNYLKVARAEARILIGRQIEEGHSLVERANGDEAVLERELATWQEYTTELIKRRLFTTQEEAEKFDARVRMMFGDDRWSELKEDLAEYLRRLQSVHKRLDFFEEVPSPPAAAAPTRAAANSHGKKEVFIVHGHDVAAKQEAARFVDQLKLKPIILDEQANKGRTIIEKFEDHAAEVGYAIVLLTPDDEGKAKAADGLRPRARQNVVLELGYFFARLGRGRVCALHKGGVELPSDIHGLLYVALDDNGAWKFRLAREMKAAGLQVDVNDAL